MALERMDLEAAGKVLGLHPNSVRARAKKGKIRSEADNAGKIWVWIDTAAANDQPTKKVQNPDVEPSMKVTIQEVVSPFESHIETLKTENEGLKSTVADLRGRLDQSEAERRKLVDAMLEKTAPPAPEERRGPLARLLGWMGPRTR